MLKTVILAQEPDTAAQLGQLAAEFHSVLVVHTFEQYPSSLQLTRVMRSAAPHVVLIDAASLPRLAPLAEHLRKVSPHCQIIAFGRGADSSTLDWLLRSGIREYLVTPATSQAFEEVMSRAGANIGSERISVRSTDLVYSFLPAKPGVGATSLALNASLRLASRAGSSALLCDLDVQSGIIRFLLKLKGTRSTVDALKRAPEMDRGLWPQYIERVGYLDVLHGGNFNPQAEFDHMYTQHLIDFAKRNYHVLCFDLPGTLDRNSLDLIHESRRTFLVCTSEACSLHLAAEKLEYLRKLGLQDRIAVLLNRHSSQTGTPLEQVEAFIGAPVFMTFSNDYARLSRSITEGKPVESSSELGRQCDSLADFMLDGNARTASALKPSFSSLKSPQENGVVRTLNALA